MKTRWRIAILLAVLAITWHAGDSAWSNHLLRQAIEGKPVVITSITLEGQQRLVRLDDHESIRYFSEMFRKLTFGANGGLTYELQIATSPFGHFSTEVFISTNPLSLFISGPPYEAGDPSYYTMKLEDPMPARVRAMLTLLTAEK